jgi:hypothetical protein
MCGVVKLHPIFFVVMGYEKMRLPNQWRQIMFILFPAFWITFASLVKAAMVMVGAGFALFLFISIIFAVLTCMVTAMIGGIHANS